MNAETETGLLKSRRAHSLPLNNSKLSGSFDPVIFAEKFNELNPELRVFNSEKGAVE